ncbi:TnsA endonuclease N-terminal domain-containing protein [Clostridium estertheticum]|uniref:TnsA endonuclease N-terminal domain-containing protein n=1 Tax=Clostridium estertheticum TaxID=238834 RepID=UPI001C0B34AC|nr:TnsA endonuclease N-terminal domain-containing protein [Clostridium estertheticum]MBU3216857.1 TnsA endonuclease N-terminal domain-containing protein [Clostridium estertheticum]WAG53955.1 TnsA endonuclease N-terminal domain-containing protein [Clostridium estertheticum]
MGKYNSNKLTTKFVQDYIKDRLWEKDNAEYVPFLSVRSVPTKGKANRIMGYKTGREHHFLTKLEYAAFYHFDWSDDVLDIKEQYPLLPIDLLQNIAVEAGIEYPSLDDEPIIMTTDFLVTTKCNDKIVHSARTVTPSINLSNKRIIEKFEIERRFFNSKGIDWAIITEKELSSVFTNNMDILHSNKLINNGTTLETQYLITMYKYLTKGIETAISKNMPIAYLLTELSKKFNIKFSDINEIFLKAIIDKIVVLDIYNKPLNITALTISDLSVNTKVLLGSVNTL